MTSNITDTAQLPQADKLRSRLNLLAMDPANRTLRGDCVSLALQQRNYHLAQQIADEALG